MQLDDGGSGDVDSLGVGAGIGRGQEEAGVRDDVVEEGDVDGGQTLELVFGSVWAAEAEAEPEALGAWARQERSAGEPFGVEGVGEIEVADVADVLYIAERKDDDSAAEIKEVDDLVVDEGRDGQIAGKGLSCESAHDNLFAGRGHSLEDCHMCRYGVTKKLSEE